MSFNSRLIDLLKTDRRFVDDEGELILAAVQDRAWKTDRELVRLLLSVPEVKAKFFEEIEGCWVFDASAFIDFISQKDFLDNSYTSFKNRIGLTIGGKFLRERGEVALVWPYKDCVLEGGQTKEEENRKEIFFNEVLAQDEINRLLDPKALTSFARYSTKGKEKVTGFKRDETGIIRENLIMKGNNLLALHVLKTQFRGQVKLIYIDPPYNTGNDSFGYNDSFSHSAWLTFMRNRLRLARELMAGDGVIVVHCDYIEDSYLKVLMDEVFGRDSFLNSISVRDSHPSGLKLSAREKTIVKTKSTMLVFKKGADVKITPVYQRRADWDIHFNSFVYTETEERKRVALSAYLAGNRVVDDASFRLDSSALSNPQFRQFAFEHRDRIFQSTKEIPEAAKEESLRQPGQVIEYAPGEFALNGRRLSPLSRSICNVGFDGYHVEDFGKLLCDFWDDIDFNNSQNEGGVSFASGKKPELLLARLLTMFTAKGDLVMDYHVGSGTTCAVAHKMGRQYIGIEQLEYGENDSVVRMQNVIKSEQSGISKAVKWQGGGDFIYCELMKYNEAFMERIQEAATGKELLAIWNKMAEGSFLNWYVNPRAPEEAVNDFIAIGEEPGGLEKQKHLLAELLDKNQLYVTLTEIDDAQFGVSQEDKVLNKAFYGEAYNA